MLVDQSEFAVIHEVMKQMLESSLVWYVRICIGKCEYATLNPGG